jgi:hypothetical protein
MIQLELFEIHLQDHSRAFQCFYPSLYCLSFVEKSHFLSTLQVPNLSPQITCSVEAFKINNLVMKCETY